MQKGHRVWQHEFGFCFSFFFVLLQLLNLYSLRWGRKEGGRGGQETVFNIKWIAKVHKLRGGEGTEQKK